MQKAKTHLVEVAVPGFLKFRANGVSRLNIYQSDDLLLCLLCPCGRVNHPTLKRYYTAYESLTDMEEKIQKPLVAFGEGRRCEACGERIDVPVRCQGFYFYFSPFVGLDFVVEMRHRDGNLFFHHSSVGDDGMLKPLLIVSNFLRERLFHPALYHFRIGYASRNLRQDRDTARKHLQKAVAADERFWQAYLELASLALEEGMPDLAADTLAKAERWSEPDDPLCTIARVQILMAQKQLPAALALCDALTGRDPENPQAHYHKGLVLAEMEDYTGARAALKQTLRLDPNHLRAANALRKMGFLSILPSPLRRLWSDKD